jgi:hypothetical protein
MHTIIVIAIGFAVLAVSVLIRRLMGGSSAAISSAALVFLPIWLIGAGINLWIGVNKAGYSIKDEAPIMLVVFAVPAAVALILWWRLKSSN